MTVHADTEKLGGADEQLVDLVESVLVDPNLHTDTRMRLYHELTELLQKERQGLPGTATGDVAGWSRTPEDRELPKMLEEVLVDPNLPTDERMRLHKEISELVRTARQRAADRAGQTS